ncbi:MAG: cell division protein FtsA [Patescibacteria group bacterium]
MGSHFVVGLDIGTSSVKAVVLERRKSNVIVRHTVKESSSGLRKGTVYDLSESVPVVAKVIDEIKKISKAATKNLYVNIGTSQVKVHNSRGIVAVSRVDNEIYQDDIDRVVKASQAVNLAPNRMVIHTLTREYVVDGVPDIANPLGLSGSRLEVQSMVVEAFAPHVKSLMKLVEMSGGEISGLVLTALASARSVLTKKQKDLGVVLIDIGFGTTGVTIYEEHKLIGVQNFPVGSGNITNDIAVGLRIPIVAAESVKLYHGSASSHDVSSKDVIDLSKFVPEAKGSVSRRFVAEIIESRLAEIFEFVNNELKLAGRAGKLAGGAVLSGGGSKLPGLADLAKQELKLSSQIGFADMRPWAEGGPSQMNEMIEDPDFAGAAGLALWGGDQEGWWKEGDSDRGFNIKKLFQYFIP